MSALLLLAALFAGLDSEEYTRREECEAGLAAMVHRHPAAYGPRVAALYASTTSSEARARGRRVVTAFVSWQVTSYAPRSVPVWPIIDNVPIYFPLVGNIHLPEAYPGGDTFNPIIAEWLEPLPFLFGYYGPTGADAFPTFTRKRTATERFIRDSIRRGMTHDEADAILAVMWTEEKRVYGLSVSKWDGAKWAGGYP